MKHFKHALEGALIALLAQAPAILGSASARDFIDKHPALAVYVPVAVGLASAAYRALKGNSSAELKAAKPAHAAKK